MPSLSCWFCPIAGQVFWLWCPCQPWLHAVSPLCTFLSPHPLSQLAYSELSLIRLLFLDENKCPPGLKKHRSVENQSWVGFGLNSSFFYLSDPRAQKWKLPQPKSYSWLWRANRLSFPYPILCKLLELMLQPKGVTQMVELLHAWCGIIDMKRFGAILRLLMGSHSFFSATYLASVSCAKHGFLC